MTNNSTLPLRSAARARSATADTQRVALLLVAPALLLMGMLYIYPLGGVLWTSFTEPQFGVGNYTEIAGSASVRRIAFTTLRICVITTAIAVFLGYVVAYAMATGSERKRRLVLMLVVAPLWVSALVRAFAWVVLLRQEGLVNNLLRQTHLIDAPLQLVWNEVGVVIGMVHYMLPYAILPLYTNMRDLDARLPLAARGLGATRLQAFRMVFLPLTVPGIAGASALVFVYSLGFFVIPAILGGGKTLMAAEYIRLQITELLQWGPATALAVVAVVAVLGLLAIVVRAVGTRRIFGGQDE